MSLFFSLLGLVILVGVTALLVDGGRLLFQRWRHEADGRPLGLVVAERREVADHLLELTLVRPDGGRLPAFTAGQHVLLQVPAGRNGRMVQRAYSLSAWTHAPDRYELGIKREQEGIVSGWIWNNLYPGTQVQLRPPKGDFVVQAGAGELVLVGGGIGITPMRAMLHAALGTGRFISLFQVARNAEELLYADEFSALADTHQHFQYCPMVSRPDPTWEGKVGRLDAARVLKSLRKPADADIYLCAGADFMDALRQGFRAEGMPDHRLHWESFGIVAASGGTGQRISLDDGGQTVEIVTSGEPTLLAALEAHDHAPPSECRSGGCGQCRMFLTMGDVRWLVEPGMPLEESVILPCICVAQGDLVIARMKP